MIQQTVFDLANLPDDQMTTEIIEFLFVNLEQYGDKQEDIRKAFDYALSKDQKPGGFIIRATIDGVTVGAAIINETGMKGYIPENILVYIAAHKGYRGKGIGTELMRVIIDRAEGNLALHVEHDNPAIHLYKKFGFTNKYLEMRLDKTEAGIVHQKKQDALYHA